MNFLTKQKETHRLRERHYGCLGKDGEGTVKEFGINKYTLLYLKWRTNKDLQDSTWKSAQCCVAIWMGGELEENGYMHAYGWIPRVVIGRTDAEAETLIFWLPDAKSQLVGKAPDAGKDWGQEEKGGNRGWGGWMASLIQWTWVWAHSGS